VGNRCARRKGHLLHCNEGPEILKRTAQLTWGSQEKKKEKRGKRGAHLRLGSNRMKNVPPSGAGVGNLTAWVDLSPSKKGKGGVEGMGKLKTGKRGGDPRRPRSTAQVHCGGGLKRR